jgi:[ribosomal protein S18]-alanine N-acetyltransferase
VVARPPVKVSIESMQIADLEAVHEIERLSFRTPWPSHAYRTELETNRLALYLVARVDGAVVAYGGMWMMADEAHITTFAVAPDRRRQRLGERLLLALLDLASAFHAHEATLEVRLSNLPARRLYEKYGFRPVGLRPRYYSDDNEDALIMTTEPLASVRLRERIDRLRHALDTDDLAQRTGMPGAASAAAAPDRSATTEAPDAGGGPNAPGTPSLSDSGGTG